MSKCFSYNVDFWLLKLGMGSFSGIAKTPFYSVKSALGVPQGGSMSALDAKTRVAGAESSRKLLQVLLLFTPTTPLWTVGDIGQQLGLTQSMVYRYVALLREVGLLDGAGGKSYRVTDLARGLAGAATAARGPLGELALPYLTRIRDASNETAFVTRRSGWFSYVVERVESNHAVRLVFERGQANALHQGSGSRLMMSQMSHADRAMYFQLFGVDREKYNPTLLSDDALDALHKVGITESFEEVGEGLWSVSAAIWVDGEIVAAVSTAAPLFRVSVAQRREIYAQVVEAAAAISPLLT